MSTNRSKSSITLNLKKDEGVSILKSLVEKSDIFVENFKVDDLKKFDLDYPSMKKINPKLIYISITGFGQTGPMANQPGYDYLIQGFGGVMSITGQSDDEPGAVLNEWACPL